MNYLSIDVGTTCCKCQLFSESGEILAYQSEEYALKAVNSDLYVDVVGIWEKVRKLIRYASSRGEVSSICISSFGEAFVLLSEKDDILFYPMLYTDPRGEEEAKELTKRFGEEKLFARTGTLPQSMFSVSKLLWIKRHYPDLYARADKVLLICDYIGYLLTGERVIDYALACRTGIFRLENKQFDEELLGELGISKSLFSKPMLTGSIVGSVKESVAKELGISPKTKLVLGSHDQICSALGAGVVKSGESVDGLGTVECITAVFDSRPINVEMGRSGYVCVPYAVDGLYCTYMFNYSSGSLVNWFRKDILHGYRGEQADFFAYMDETMGEEPSGLLTLPYFAGAATPYQNINAKGAILNLTTRTKDSDLYRSILEGTAMEMRVNMEKMREFGVRIERAVATGGGANSDRWLQIKADIQNISIQTLRSSEGGLCGCAILQAVAMGGASSYDEAVNRFVVTKRQFFPNAERHLSYRESYEKYKKLYDILKEFN